jgi:hypothetical protein
MNYLEDYLKNDHGNKKIRRNYEIDDSLYVQLEHISEKYHTTISELINISIRYLLKTQDIKVYKKEDSEITVVHTISLTLDNIRGLEYLRTKYGVSIYKLVNIAIRNAVSTI